MTSPIPGNERIPDVYQRFVLEATGGQGIGPLRVLYIGYRALLASDASDYIARRISTRSDASLIYGAGSQLDVMAINIFEVARIARNDDPPGRSPEIYFMSVPPPSGGGTFATIHTMAFTGSVQANGSITVTAGQETVSVGLAAGEDSTTVAARVKEQLDRVAPNLCVTFASTSGTVIGTARELGSFGNQMTYSVDTENAPGITATLARPTSGAGFTDLTLALEASLNQDFDAVVITQDDSATLALAKDNIQRAWDYTVDQPRMLIIAQSGDISDAQTSAALFNTAGSGAAASRVVIAHAEQVAASITGDLTNSARTPAYQLTAGFAARIYSQQAPTWNFNRARVPGQARPRATLDRQVLNDTIAAGVSVLIREEGVTQVVDPVNASTTDQQNDTGAPDLRWQPIEITKTVRVISRVIKVSLARFTQATATELTRAAGKTAALTVLRTAARNQFILPVNDDAVTATFALVDGATHLVLTLQYSVIVGIDIVAVTHTIVR